MNGICLPKVHLRKVVFTRTILRSISGSRTAVTTAIVLRICYFRPVLLHHPSLDVAGPRCKAGVLRLEHARLDSELRSIHDAVGFVTLGREFLLDLIHTVPPVLRWLPGSFRPQFGDFVEGEHRSVCK